MAKPRRTATAVYLDRRIAEAAKGKAARTGRSLSELVNEGLARILSASRTQVVDEGLMRLRIHGWRMLYDVDEEAGVVTILAITRD